MTTNVRRSLALSFLEKYASFVVQIGSGLIVARLITPEAFGTFAVAYAIVGFAHVIRDMGVSSYLIQVPELQEEDIRAALFATGIVAWSLGLALWLASPLVGSLYGEQVRTATRILLLSFLIMPLSSTILASLQREMEFGALLRINLAGTLVNAATGIALAAQGLEAAGLAWASVAGQATIALVAAGQRPQRAHFWPSSKGVAKVIRFGTPIMISSLLLQLSGNVANLITARFVSLAAMGLFMRAHSVTDLFSRMIMNAVQPMLLPLFAAEQRSGRDLGSIYWRTMRLVGCVTWPLFIFLALYAEPIIIVLFGEQWRASGPLLAYMAIGGLFWFVGYLVVALLAAAGRPGLILRGQAVNQSIAIVGVLLAARHGVEAVAQAAILISAAHGLIWMIIAQAHIRLPVVTLARSLLQEALFLIVLISLPLLWSYIGYVDSPILYLSVGIACLATAWLCAALIVDHPVVVELRELLQILLLSFGRYRQAS